MKILSPLPQPLNPSCWDMRPSSIHGQGLFARYPLLQDQCILEYAGRRISKSQSLELCRNGNPYIFNVHEDWDLDGDVDWNPARFINHCCDPNCEAVPVRNRVWIITLRPIPAGQELTFNYGYDLEDYRAHECRCGSPNCVGYIVAQEFFAHIAKPANL